MDFSEWSIAEVLHRKYKNCRYKITNTYIFKHDWETDFFLQNRDGYCYEFEIKISRADFFNDKAKVTKHEILETGKFFSSYHKDHKEHNFRPNRFYYIVPDSLISTSEVPHYAGLIYVMKNGTTKIVKKAPLIHKEIFEFEKHLCIKFYFKWLNSMYDNKRLVAQMKEIQKNQKQ